jgi:hypothetical protein
MVTVTVSNVPVRRGDVLVDLDYTSALGTAASNVIRELAAPIDAAFLACALNTNLRRSPERGGSDFHRRVRLSSILLYFNGGDPAPRDGEAA